MSGLSLRFFGPFEGFVGGEPLPHLRSRKGYLLLALLALRPDAPVSRDFVIGTLWPESDQDAGAMNLRRTLHDLRAALGPAQSAVESPDKRHLRLDTRDAQIDIQAFESAGVGRPAAELYRGPFLAGFDDDWIVGERQRFQERALTILLTLGEAALADAPEQALDDARRAAQLDPYHEAAQRLLYRALATVGDPAGARRAYRDFRLRLHEELRQEPSAETRRCLETLPAPRTRANPTAIAPPDTLPLFLSSFLGRADELRRVGELLQRGRLTTVVGTGGVGKTRLAVEVARAAAGAFPDGLSFADLSALEADAAPERLWQLLGNTVGDGPASEERSPQERFVAQWSDRNALLLLDNAEQVRQAAAAVGGALLRAAPGLRLLVTSRAPLGLHGEQLFPLEPLVSPRSDALGAVLDSDAALLFVQRAQAIRPDFALTPQNAPEIARICQQLDGLPLALELAAVRLRLMTPAELARRLADPLHTLAGSDLLPERQRTLEKLISWSYTRLSPTGQRLFRQLSVFPERFTLATVEWIVDDPAALDTLATLVDSSLVQVSEDSAGSTRYHLLEIVRAYARARLAESQEEAEVQRRLSAWGGRFLTEAYDGLWGVDGGLWLRRIAAELPNLRAAVAAGDADAALAQVQSLNQFWWRTGRFAEGIDWYTLALEKPGGSPRRRLPGEIGREQFRQMVGEPHALEQTLDAAIGFYQAEGSPETSIYLTHTLALFLAADGRPEQAEAPLRAALALVPTLAEHQDFFAAYLECGLAEVLQRAGRPAEARGYAQSALDGFTALRQNANQVRARLQLGLALLGDNQLAAAEAALTRGLDDAQRDAMRDQELEFRIALGQLAAARGDFDAARRWYDEVLQSAGQGASREQLERTRRAREALATPT